MLIQEFGIQLYTILERKEDLVKQVKKSTAMGQIPLCSLHPTGSEERTAPDLGCPGKTQEHVFGFPIQLSYEPP